MAIKQKTHRNCANPACGNEFKLFKSTDKYCSSACYFACNEKKPAQSRTRIAPMSQKRQVEKLQYDADRTVFLGKPENKNCAIKGPTCTKKANTIEHTRGRVGYADDWARENKITLYLDKRFWLPACCNCNIELENNPELSKKFQLSKIHGGKKG